MKVKGIFKSTIGIRNTLGGTIFDSLNILLMLILMIITLYPFLYVLVASISVPSRLAVYQSMLFWPQGFSIESYRAVFSNMMIKTGYINTIGIMIVGTMISLSLTAVGAYVLSRKNLMWIRPMTLFVVFTMFFNGGLIPKYLIVNGIGLVDSYFALILPTAISTYNLIVMRTSFKAIPDAVEESATIDGAGDLRIFWQIILPLSAPVIAVMILFYGVSYWNSWFPAMIYLQNRSKYPLQLVLRSILIENSTGSMTTDIGSLDREALSVTIKYATIMVATIPILFVYPFLQKYFTKGIMIGSVKG